MTGITIKYIFFDSEKVLKATERAQRRVLSKFGAFVRRSAKSSIRKRKRISVPGEPPSSHTGLLKKFIFFGYDRNRSSVIIGPQRLNQQIGDAPAAMEHGGMSMMIESSRGKRKKRRVNIKARPFMRPALEQNEPKLPAMWLDSVK